MTVIAPQTGPTRFLTDTDIKAVYDWRDAVAALRSAYAAPASATSYPPRSMARGEGVWLRTLTGVTPDGKLMGAKLIAASIRGKAASYLIALYDQDSAALLALLDGNAITGFRTAATSALATDVLTGSGPLTVGVIGSGFEAKTHIRALASLRELKRVTVFSPNPASRERFIAELADLSIDIGQADSAEAAIDGANVALCAARSRDESPTLRGAWLRPGMTVVSIGSTLPEQRELDAEAIARAERIIADMPEEVAHETGDMLAATAQGVTFEEKLVGLDAVIGGSRVGRGSVDQVILYKSVGGAIQDLAVAAMCLRRAQEAGKGTLLPVSIEPVAKGK